MSRIETEEFLLKENTYEEEVKIDEARFVTVRVSRTRTSKGEAAIFLKIGGNKRIELSNDANTYSDAYSNVASAVVALLQKALDNPCSIPKI